MSYELLAYLSVRATQLGMRACEIPVARAYPKRGRTPTKITTEQQNDLKRLLDTKYMVSDIKRIDIILQRIKDNLALSYNLAEQPREAEAAATSSLKMMSNQPDVNDNCCNTENTSILS